MLPEGPKLFAARVGDYHLCPGTPTTPHVGGSILYPCAPDLSWEGAPAARLGDKASCQGELIDVITQGSASFLINGLPAGRVTDKTVHGGFIFGPGAMSILIGGPTFALPPNIEIVGDADFQSKVIRDLYLLWTTKSGQELFRRLGAHPDKNVTIRPKGKLDQCDEERHNPNAPSTESEGSTVNYDPDKGALAEDAQHHPLNCPPQEVLAHELCHSLADIEGRDHAAAKDPSPPKSETNIPENEAVAIGTGSHSADYPSENSFREELGLRGRRDNHSVKEGQGGKNLRPGGP